MKLSISVLLQRECGGWANIRYEILDSNTTENYQTIKKELIKKLALKINRREKRFKKTNISLTFGELREKNVSVLVEPLSLNPEVLDSSNIEMTLNEWNCL